MTPTRGPTWRSFALAIGIIQLLGIVMFVSSPGSVGAPRLDSAEDRTALFFMALTLGGAATMTRRPALGFSIFGAGWLVGAVAALILAPRKTEILLPVAVCTTLGILYSVLGVKEMGGVR